jgi:hypothetical protein
MAMDMERNRRTGKAKVQKCITTAGLIEDQIISSFPLEFGIDEVSQL